MYRINQKRLINTFIELARISSPSWKEKKVIEYIARRLKKLGLTYRALPCGDSYNLLVRVNGTKKALPVLFSAHMDTVLPCDTVNPILTKTKIISDGTTILGSDDKSAIAMFLEALEILSQNNTAHGPIEILFSCAEELGLEGMKHFDFSTIKSKYAFVFDSDGDVGNIIVKAPYHVKIELHVQGKAAHAGLEPEKGINAINALSEIITKIPAGRIDDATTINIGTISGGTAINVVAEYAHCSLELRSLRKDRLTHYESIVKKTIKEICRVHRTKYQLHRTLLYSGFAIADNKRILKIATDAMKHIGIAPVLKSSGGGSDTNIINSAGIKAINLACGMRNVHSTTEYILISDLVKGAKLVLSLIESV